MLFVSKQQRVESLLKNYCQQTSLCLEQFRQSLQHYFKTNDRAELEQDYNRVHEAESKADDLRRDVEVLIYSKTIFPESRGDILGLLETMDRAPNQAESCIRMLWNQHISVPTAFQPGIIQLAEVCCRSVEAMIDAVTRLFDDFTNATVAVGRIDELESEADRLESTLVEQVFSSTEAPMTKLLLRDLIKHISSISDRAENTGDRIRIIVAKRRI